MELKRRQEIKLMNQYLPGYVGGYTPLLGTLQFGVVNNMLSGDGKAGSAPTTLNLANGSTDTRGSSLGSILGNINGDIVTSAIGFAGATSNAFGPVKGTNELMSDAGRSYASGAGFGYERLNDIDLNRELSELSRENTNNTLSTMGSGAALGAAVGSIVPGLGTIAGGIVGGAVGLFTGIFGGESRRKRLERKLIEAERGINRMNMASRSSAHSDYLASYYNQNHAYTADDVLYGAKGGKDMFTLLPGYVAGYDVHTANGRTSGRANSRVAFGETIYNPTEGSAHIVKTGRLNEDSNLANLRPDDIVYGNHVDWNTGMTFRDEALPYAALLERLRDK